MHTENSITYTPLSTVQDNVDLPNILSILDSLEGGNDHFEELNAAVESYNGMEEGI